MKLNVYFLENNIAFDSSFVNSIEIENKKYFYRLVKGLIDISNNEENDDISFIDNKEKFCTPSLKIISDYFNIDINNKKVINEMYKNIVNDLDETMICELTEIYKKTSTSLKKILKNFDLPLTINQEYENDLFLKTLKISIKVSDNLFDNLLLIIDVNKLLKIYSIIIFINLKQYLNKDEINELYKYAIYNNVLIMLIDSQSYGISINNEKKLLIDDDLDEFVL